MKTTVYHFLLLVSFFNISFSQHICNLDSIFCDSYEHTKSFFLSPLHFEKEEYKDLAIVAGITGISFLADKPINKIFADNKNHNNFMDNVTTIGNNYGTTKVSLVIVGGTLLTGFVTDNDEIIRTGTMFIESAIFSAVITQSLKMLIGRERPGFTTNHLHFIGPNLSLDQFQSLPSGHATHAFAISTVAAGVTDNTYLKILFYSPAVLTAFSRIYRNRHWFSDVMLGSFIGYYTGKKVLSLNGYSSKENRIDVSLSHNSIGIIFKF
jgi:membrane-associated phospholipid phosphatase